MGSRGFRSHCSRDWKSIFYLSKIAIFEINPTHPSDWTLYSVGLVFIRRLNAQNL